MITQILFSCLGLHSPSVAPDLWLGPLAIGKPTTYLRSFLDPETLQPGEPIFVIPPPLAPKVPFYANQSKQELPALSPKPGATTVLAAMVSRPQPLGTAVSEIKGQPQPKAAAPEDVVIHDLHVAGIRFDQLLAIITRQAGTGVIMISKPDVKLTYSAQDRRFIDVLKDICGLAGVSYLKVGHDYVINSDDELKKYYPEEYAKAHPDKPAAVRAQPDIVSQVYRTNYCDANKLIATLQTVPDCKSPDLTCIAAPASVSPTLDSTDESQKSGQTASVLTKDQNALAISRTIFLRGPKALVEEALETLAALDQAPAQVNISVQIHDISLDAEKNLGINWTFGQIAFNEQSHSGIGFGSVDRTPFSFQATLNALMTKNEEKLLASPNITVQDGERAYVLVGQRLDFPIIVSYTQSGQPVFNTDQERVGIYLQVSVWVTNDGKVKLNLYPQVSTVTGFINVNGGNYPQIATREAQTTLTVESGKMIAIGGLIHEEDIKNVQDVPILSKIPIIGEFFRNHQVTHSKDEVLITITPTILPNK